jgi:hypothetical protein
MLRAGSQYRIGEVTHIFPQLQVRGNYHYTAKDERNHLLLLQLLREFDTIADDRGLDYTICGGTLLGAIRHDGFIPWDGDADVDLPKEQAVRLEQVFHNNPRYTLKKTGYGYKIMKQRTLYPFLDVFLTELAPDQEKIRYVHAWTRELYPQYLNEYNDIHPRRRYVFENLTLWGPCNGILLCERTYGSNCLQVALIDARGHITEEWRNNVLNFFQRLFKPQTPAIS